MNRVALQMLIGDRAKYMGLVFGIMFSTLLMAQQTSIFIGIMKRTASQILDVREADIWVMDPRATHIDEVEPLPDTAVGRIRGVPGVEWAAPLYDGRANLRSRDGQLQQVIMMGIDDATLAGAPPVMVLGKIEDLRRPDALVMDRAGYLFLWPNEPLQTGKVVELNERRAVIVGICEASAPFMTAPVVYTRYSLALNYAPQRRNALTFVIAKSREGEDVQRLCAEIKARTGYDAYTWSAFVWKTVGYYLERTGIPVNFGITIALGFLVGAAIAGQTFYLFVNEKMKEFGALKAIGVTNTRIVGMVLLQAMVAGVIGYSLGIGVSAVFFEVTSAKVLNFRGMYMPWQVMAGVAAAVFGIVLLVSVVSVRRVLVVDPAIVFRG